MAEEHPFVYHDKLLTQLTEDVGQHDARLNALERTNAVQDEQIRNLFIAVGRIEASVDGLKDKPGKRWESVVDTILKIALGAILTFLTAKILGQ